MRRSAAVGSSDEGLDASPAQSDNSRRLLFIAPRANQELANGQRKTKEGGPDPERQSYHSYAAFEDPDGNAWIVQEVTRRAPGRELPK